MIRTHNRADTLEKAVQSVLDQTYRPVEIVLVNDGGEAINPALLAKVQDQDVSLHVIRHSLNKGRSAAANTALQAAKGQALMFLDDDDWIDPIHISRLVEVLQNNPDLIAVYSDTACILSESNPQIQKVYDYNFDALRLAFENFLPIHSVLFRNNDLTQSCRFNTQLSVYEDWNFWIQISSLGRMQRVAGITAWYSAGLSGIGFKTAQSDYTQSLADFFKSTVRYYTPQQISTIFFMCRHFFVVAEKNKEHEQWIKKLQQQLADCHTRDFDRELQFSAQYKEIATNQDNLRDQLSHYADELSRLKVDTSTLNQQLTQIVRSTEIIKDLLLQEQQSRWSVKIKPFSNKVRRKGRTFFLLLKAGDLHGIYQRLVSSMTRLLGQSHTSSAPSLQPHVDQAAISILCTPHTRYVAGILKSCLEYYGLKVTAISDDAPEHFSHDLYFVICPQLFQHLPERYVAFQMEQTVSNRWFDERYCNILNKALAVVDYSQFNLKFLQQRVGIDLPRLFLLPISYLEDHATSMTYSGEDEIMSSAAEYDVVFYGDINNDRRRYFLDEIGKHFKVLVVREVFGSELYAQLRSAKVLVNIHYYENALLETTRIYEALSLGLNIVSEASADMADHRVLNPWVAFTPIGDVDAMIAGIRQLIDAPIDLSAMPDDPGDMRFHAGRMLVALGLIDTACTSQIPCPYSLDDLNNPLCLSMPESFQRHQTFKERHPDVSVFHGLRFSPGWIGCGLSYSYLAQQAVSRQQKYLEVWEDDVVLDESALLRWQNAKALFLDLESGAECCDLLSGLLADVSDATQVLDVFEYKGDTYLVIDRMISAVCNFYGEKVIAYMAEWDSANRDVNHNTMDRYLENKRLRVLVPMPFIAGHNPEQSSTLWGCQNSQYDTLISSSQEKLYQKMKRFVSERVT